MNMRDRPGLVVAVAVMLTTALSCSHAITTRILVPAKAHEAAKLKRIAVLPFEGRRGYQLAADLEALLSGITVDNRPYYNLIERAAIEDIIREQKLHLSGLVDQETAVDLGEMLGAQGIIMGTVTQHGTDDQRFTEKRSKCLEKDEDDKCVKQRKYTVDCTQREAYFAFTPKVVDVSTGAIMASKSLSGKSTARVCTDAHTPLQGRREMLAAAKRSALDQFRRLIAPHYVHVRIQLVTKDDSGIAPDAKRHIRSGVKWSRSGRLDRACEDWRAAHAVHPRGYAIPYLLGVCAEIAGDLEEALNYYERADRNTGHPVEEINAAISRVNLTLDKKQKLEEQMGR